MNIKKEERTKAIAAVVGIVLGMIILFVRLKSILIPKGPNAVPQTAAAPASPSPGGAATGAPTPAAPVTTPGAATPGAVATGAPATGGVSSVPNSNNGAIPNIVVRDPFVMTPTYKSRIPDKQAALGGPSGTVKPSVSSSMTYKPGPSFPSFGSSASSLPPANVRVQETPSSSFTPSSQAQGAGSTTANSPSSQGREPMAATTPNGSTAANPAGVIDSLALTGTIEGDIPMAILHTKDRSYLVRVGDWLDNTYQVRRISARQVVLKDRAGHTRILQLGGITNAT